MARIKTAVRPPMGAPDEEAVEDTAPDLIEQVTQKPKGVVTAADLKGGNVTLPTGIVVKIRRASLMALAAAGHIPNPLLPIAVKAAKLEDVTISEDEYADLAPTERAVRKAQDDLDMERLIDAVVCAVVVEPKIVAEESEETEDNVWVGSLFPMDKQTIYLYAQYPQSYWAKFRSGE